MAAGDDLLCNFRKCRKRVNTFGWVTSCSHIFCDEDGTREFQKGYSCPACEANLSGKYDVVRVELQPPEQYKSMILAGHRPEIIMEIATRALSFWTYQIFQERTYQEYVANNSKEKTSQMEKFYEQTITKAQTEISSLKNQISAKSKELEETKARLNEISENLIDKNRQYLKLQGMYDTLRRKSITPKLMVENEDRRTIDSRTSQIRNAFQFPLDTGADLLRRNEKTSSDNPMRIALQAEQDFVLRPSLQKEQQEPLIGTPSRSLINQVPPNRFTLDFAGTPTSRHHYQNK